MHNAGKPDNDHLKVAFCKLYKMNSQISESKEHF